MCECGHYWTVHNEWSLLCCVNGCPCSGWEQGEVSARAGVPHSDSP